MPHQIPLGTQVYDLVHDQQWDRVAALFRDAHPADIAEVIDNVHGDDRRRLFALVQQHDKPEVLAELEDAAGAEVLGALTNAKISELVEDMAPDDAADVLADLPGARSEQVLQLMEDEESRDVRELLKYEEDTAGGIMTTDVVAMSENQTVAEALAAIAYLDTGEQFYNANIVDDAGRLVGYVDVWELLRERDRGRPLGELVHKKFASATVDMDQEEVARIMNRYDLNVLSVTDDDGLLVGRITNDDVIDVMEEEASEDIFRLAGSDDAELESPSVVRSCAARLPWLLITLAGGAVTSLILRHFHSQLSGFLILGAFVPIVLAMGGNTGIQSSTLVVRSIALGDFRNCGVLQLLAREIAIGAAMGGVCAVAIGFWARFLIRSGAGALPVPASSLAAIVAVALFSAMTFAAVFGALVPLALHRLKVDPAVASGPFVTITNDISALLIYFGVTVLLLQTFA